MIDKACENRKSPSREFEQKLSQMSPFEIKGTLIDLAELDARCSTSTFLNAGRGNPNWLLSYPRKAFFLLGQFAMQEADRKAYNADWGIVASPSQKGVAERFRQFIADRKDDVAAKVLNHFYTMLPVTSKPILTNSYSNSSTEL